jgi:hypothetical protein
MGRKRIFTDEEVMKIIDMYNKDMLGTPSIATVFNVDKGVINRILKSNGIVLGPSGRKYKGGKSESDKRYYNKNKDKISEYHANWRVDNKETLREYHSEWRSNNKDKVKYYSSNYYDKVMSDPTLKLVKNIRTALWSVLAERNMAKYGSTFSILGYSPNELIAHLESLFTEGMSWENYGEWHVDHIIPISQFNFTDYNDYEFTKCWSLSNLRPMWATNKEVNGTFYEGNLNKNNTLPKICYQYRVKERKRVEEIDTLPFNPKACSFENCNVRLIDKESAKKVIEEYEWLGYMPSYTKYHFGLFFTVDDKEYLGGVLTFQDDYVSNTTVWDKYNYKNKILLLSRGVCLWWTPKNSNSFFIGKALKWLSLNTEYKVITATVDSLAGEIGTIYQAANWVYVGVMAGNILPNGKERERLGVIIDGKSYTSRQIRGMLGTMKKEVILEHYPLAKFIKHKAKSRYFYFLGTKKEREYYKGFIADQIKPYPKR